MVEIADYFNLNHYGSVGFTTHKIRKRKREDRQFNRKLIVEVVTHQWFLSFLNSFNDQMT